MKQAISILLEKQDDSLVRLTGLFYRRRYLVESLLVEPASQHDRIRVTAVISSSQETPRQLLNYVAKLIDVVSVEEFAIN